jgi:hypothetical protein
MSGLSLPRAVVRPVRLAMIGALLILARPSAVRGLETSAQQSWAELCSAVEAQIQESEREEPARAPRLAREEPNLTADGSRGPARLCLVYYPALDLYRALIGPVDTLEQFHAAKVEALRRLEAGRVDLCRVSIWLDLRQPPLGLGPDDGYGLPVTCAPSVVAGDPSAGVWLPEVREAAARVVDVVAREMEWRADRALTIVVYTEPERAATMARRSAPEGLGEDHARRARAGRSYLGQNQYGNLLVLLLFGERGFDPQGPTPWLRTALDRRLGHEYTHFAQLAIGDSRSMPWWLFEGQAIHMEHQIVGASASVDLATALGVLREGRTARVADLTRQDQWFGHEQRLGESAVYSRGYAAVAFLAERHGFPTTVELLRAGRSGGYDQVYERLAQLTALDLATLDGALDAWLTAPGRVLLRDDFSTPLSGWRLVGEAREPSGYEGGEYRLVSRGDTVAAAEYAELFDDFLVEVDVRLTAATEGASVVLGFRGQANRGYMFWVTPDQGGFYLSRYGGAGRRELIPRTRTAVLWDGGATNRLGVRAQGAEIVLLINGQEVGRVTDDTSLRGQLGFVVTSRGEGETDARFSNLVVANPS